MTREQVKELIPFLQAFADGAPIQALRNDKWHDMGNDADIDPNFCKYRVKPKDKYRPFNNCKECWEEMQKHVPFGWIASKTSTEHEFITYMKDDDSEYPFYLRINGEGFDFETLFNEYTFTDGTPFGIKE